MTAQTPREARLRSAAARPVRALAEKIWQGWRMDEVRHLTDIDIQVILLVGRLDSLANKIDGIDR